MFQYFGTEHSIWQYDRHIDKNNCKLKTNCKNVVNALLGKNNIHGRFCFL